ncbi:hypothetical protein GO755_35925 [Spirosoma sp. HMF4905]|uniref:DUF1648 domain-containing protein n=1 Tax=Spirosoma arboris TaxID=2682092 RepID=A0A7K1SPF8_9BACT|nr:hypothetical protein [Spirosoma arboris]MVM35466.1 hypothetical protein [Spirosoma arboris]
MAKRIHPLAANCIGLPKMQQTDVIKLRFSVHNPVFQLMKTRYKIYSLLIVGIPLLGVWLVWDYLPGRFPIYLNDNDKPDHFVSRQEWLRMLLSVLFILGLIRSVVLALLSKRINEQDVRFTRIYLLSAAFISSILGLFTMKTVYHSSDFLPVLLVLFGAAGVYLTVATNRPSDDQTVNSSLVRQRNESLSQMHTLSRLALIRVNLLAALVMLFARSEDRWTIGITANLLALAALSVMEVIRRPSG